MRPSVGRASGRVARRSFIVFGRARVAGSQRRGGDLRVAPARLASLVRDDGSVTYLPSDVYAEIERSMPIACVDFVPVREKQGNGAAPEVGLILRQSPFGLVWCHLGGRVLRGETLAGAIRRHARDRVGTDVALPPDPQPDYVYQWFPPEIVPDDAPGHGEDPRKHAIGLSFIVALTGEPSPANEALDFAYFPLDTLPDPLWPGTQGLLERLLPGQSVT